MPTPDPSYNGCRRGSRGLRGTSDDAGRHTGTASLKHGLAVAFLAIGVLSAGCSQPAGEVDVAAREASADARIAAAREYAAQSLPEGAEEVARLGYVPDGVPASHAAPPLSNTFASVEELAAAIVEGISQNRGQAIWDLALTKQEFHDVVWPVLPASRPERNTPFDYTWGTLEFKSSNALNTTLAKYQGHDYELLEVDFVAHEQRQREYGAFVVHRDGRVKVRKEDGSEEWLDVFGSVIERNGRYKVFSFVVD